MTTLVIVVIAIIVIWVVLASADANNPQKQLAHLQDWLNSYAERDYRKVQDKLTKDIQTRYDSEQHLGSERQYNERRNQDRVELRENELWRRHILTVMSSDKYSIDAKGNAARAWHDYIRTTERVNTAIELGYLDSDDMDDLGKSWRESRNALIGVMAAFDFDLEKETKQFQADVAKEFPTDASDDTHQPNGNSQEDDLEQMIEFAFMGERHRQSHADDPDSHPA